MTTALALLLKLAVTLGIFAAIFLEFGGGYVPVAPARLGEPGAFAASNPAYPCIVGRLRARLAGRPLPPARLPVSLDEVCAAATDRTVFVRAADGTLRPFKPLRHCTDRGLATVYVPGADGRFAPVPLAEAPSEVFFRIRGFQLVPADLADLWREVRRLRLEVFLPWFLAAIAIKLVGIFANVLRWQVLLAGQGIRLGFGYLTSTYFVGRYFGIVTPSTMGLDAGRLTHGQSFGELVGALKLPLLATAVLGVLVLLQPRWFRGVLRLVPSARVRRFAANVIESATAYANHRPHLLLALALAVVGQITTTLMYFANAMALGGAAVRPTEVLFASAVMTFGTFVAPSASGEGVRELVFVWLLGSKAGAAKAFLIGNLGFWIEKVPLSVPGGLLLLLRRDPALHGVTREDLERVGVRAAAR